MDNKPALLEAAELLRKAASLLESVATGNAPSRKAARVTGLRKKISALLSDGKARTSEEVTEALYSPSMGIDRGTFSRRVIVTISSMHKIDRSVVLVIEWGTGKRSWRISRLETATPPKGGDTVSGVN